MPELHAWLTVILAGFLIMLAPGPDVAIITRNIARDGP